MTTLDKAKKDIVALIKAAKPEFEADPGEIVRPPQKEMGDLSFPCFSAAKTLKSAPPKIAAEIAVAAKPLGLVAAVEAAGPYLNIRLDKKAFATAVLEEVLGSDKAFAQSPASGQRVMIEYGSPNTHKEIHVGHLRNFTLGLAVEKLLRAAGHEVTPVNYIGDIGAHVAKWLWYYDKKHPGGAGAEGIPFGRIYTEATRLAESDEEKYKPEISAVLQALERHEPKWEAVWLQTRDKCLGEMRSIFEELGIRFERTYLESEVEGPGKALAHELLEKGIAKKGEGGALIVDFESVGLGVFLVLKSDGTALYSTKELALAKLKFSEYPGTTKSMHVVDVRQSLYFQQFFATLKLMGFDKEMVHLGYEFVTLKEGAMSSRKGNIVTYEDFRDEMKKMAAAETRKRREEWSEEKIAAIAWTVAEGAMKFAMLKQDNDRPIVFDMEAALSFDGFTGPYIQYAHARLSSILAKAEGETVSLCKASDDAQEYAFLRLIADLPEMVRQSAAAHRPSLLSQYLFDLAQAANGFYRDVPVLSAPHDERCRRLAIARAGQIALSRGLGLLGISAPDEM